MRLLPLVLAAAVGIGVPSVAPAQAASPPLAPGAMVRVWSPELPRRQWAAVLGAWSPDSLELHAPTRRGRAAPEVEVRPEWVVSRHSVTRLDVLVPRTRKEGARAGGLAGVALGALAGVVLGGLVAGLGAEGSSLVLPVGASVAASGALGALFGAAVPGRHWRTVPLRTLGHASP